MGIFRDNVIEAIPQPPSLVVVEEGKHTELNTDSWSEGLKPEIPFSKMFYLNDHDSRLYLASDTYVQLMLGAGIIVTGENKKTVERVKKWFDKIGFEEKIEDGAHSYIIAGNLIMEKFDMMADIEEADIVTFKSVERDKKGKIIKYIQHVNNKDIDINPKTLAHLKLTNRRREVWGRSLFQSIITPRIVDNREEDSAIEEMWKVEKAMVKIFQSYASPIAIINFKDAGEQWIKDKEQDFKKAGPGTKILTDKEFDIKIFEVNPQSKYDKYIEHLEKDIIEAGSQFATQIFTAGFTARASSESSADIIRLKIKRIQNRFGLQIKQQIVDPFLKAVGKNPEKEMIRIGFQFEAESELMITDVIGLFEKGGLNRQEVRKHLDQHTNIDIDTDDKGMDPPITSVTPTNDMQPQPVPTPQPAQPDPNVVQIPKESLERLISIIAEKIPNPRGRIKEEASPDTVEAAKLKLLKKLYEDIDKDD